MKRDKTPLDAVVERTKPRRGRKSNADKAAAGMAQIAATLGEWDEAEAAVEIQPQSPLPDSLAQYADPARPL